MPASILDALRDQGLDERDARPAPRAPSAPVHAAATDEIPRTYQPPDPDDDEDAATRVHRDGHKVALGIIEKAAETKRSEMETVAPPTTKAHEDPDRHVRPTAPPPPMAAASRPAPPRPITAPTHATTAQMPAPPAPAQTAALATPPVPRTQAFPPAGASVSPAQPYGVQPLAGAPPAPPFALSPTGPVSGAYAPPFPGYSAPPPPAGPYPMAPEAAPQPSNMHWIVVVVISFLVTLAVFGAVISRFL